MRAYFGRLFLPDTTRPRLRVTEASLLDTGRRGLTPGLRTARPPLSGPRRLLALLRISEEASGRRAGGGL
jgi:hypothetical protein